MLESDSILLLLVKVLYQFSDQHLLWHHSLVLPGKSFPVFLNMILLLLSGIRKGGNLFFSIELFSSFILKIQHRYNIEIQST